MNRIAIFIALLLGGAQAAAQQAVVKEQPKTMKTYPFSDPNPVARPSNDYYPYFRFDGFAAKSTDKDWKTVTLENNYIKVTMFPEIGGKIWGATDKTTGKAFVYDNGVVKFRDIALRGAWVSGGIEFNFGFLGHTPTSSTPVDYLVKQKDDGSVSCYVFSYEWLTRTAWTVEVNVPKDKAYFTTHTTWYNQSPTDQPYYHWMNAGYPVGDNAEFCYPGNHQIGHDGGLGSFPIDSKGRNIGWYNSNNFEGAKSYHVLGYYNDYYGVYWHGEDFGSIHHAAYDEKLGMKIFLWSLSREGGIWEDLLTDSTGQYIELQSGRIYNQAVPSSSYTPFKHPSFAPQQTDEWTEYWYPVKGIQGVSKASAIGALHVERGAASGAQSGIKLAFSPLEALNTEVKVYKDSVLLKTLPLATKVLEPTVLMVDENIPEGHLKVVIGEDKLVYSEIKTDYELERPMQLPADFDWDSAMGRYILGEQALNQKYWESAERRLKSALEKDKYLSPALNTLASLYYREGRYDESMELSKRALSLDTYDGKANYFYALACRAQDKATEAKAAFSIAALSPDVRTAAYEQLGEMFAKENNWEKAEHYALKSLEYNNMNLHARQLLAVAYRKTSQKAKAEEQIAKVLDIMPLYHPARFEKFMLGGNTESALKDFTSLIRNELPQETYIEMAAWYENLGCNDEALTLYRCAGNYPIALYRTAWLLAKTDKQGDAADILKEANSQSPEMVFPFRAETLKSLEWAATESNDWKIRYYQALTLWANQQTEKTKELLNSCESADFAPLYLTRASLKHGDEQLADIKKAENIEASWRVGQALLNHYTEWKNWNKVVETGKKYNKKYPDNYYIGLKYAKGLCETGQYAACISLLNKLTVLPNEGASAGRDVYRTANMYQAMELLNKKKYDAVLKSVEASKQWPENLGVGKPYDDQIDNTVENYLEAEAYYGKGDKAKAAPLYEKVAAINASTDNFSSRDLLKAISLKKTGKTSEADALAKSWNERFADNKAARLCTAAYNNDTAQVNELLKGISEETQKAPWEKTFRDGNIDLVARIFAK